MDVVVDDYYSKELSIIDRLDRIENLQMHIIGNLFKPKSTRGGRTTVSIKKSKASSPTTVTGSTAIKKNVGRKSSDKSCSKVSVVNSKKINKAKGQSKSGTKQQLKKIVDSIDRNTENISTIEQHTDAIDVIDAISNC